MNLQTSLTAGLLGVVFLFSSPSHGVPFGQNSGQFDAQINFYEPIGQSFVAQDPFLSTIGFAFSDINASFPNEPVTMTLRQGSGLAGTVVRSVTQTLPAVLPGGVDPPQIINFDFSGTSLTVGQSYTVAVTVPTSPKVAVVYSGTDVYAGGQLFEGNATSDLLGGPLGGPSQPCTTQCDLNFQVVPGTVLFPGATILPVTGNAPNGFTATQTWIFLNPQPRNWFDPPLANGFLYELLGGGTFTEVMGVPGFFGLDVVINNVVFDSDLNPGESFLFGGGVSAFSLLGITPPVDAADPTAFPTFLDFSGSPTQLHMTALQATANGAGVPEPGSLALLGIALGAFGLSRRRKKA